MIPQASEERPTDPAEADAAARQGTDDRATGMGAIVFHPSGRWWTSAHNAVVRSGSGETVQGFARLRDCTLREGEEMAGANLSRPQKLALAKAIAEVGVDEIEVGYVGAIDEHREIAFALREAGVSARLTSLNRAYAREGEWQREIEAAATHGADRVELLVFFNDDLLASIPWLTAEDVPDRIQRAIAHAKGLGVGVETMLVGAWQTPRERVRRYVEAAASAGAEVVGLADSTGCAMPEAVSMLMDAARNVVGSRTALSFHGHNTFGLATANALAAIRAGASIVDTVPLGLGEGAGIAPMEELAFALEVGYGVDTGLHLDRIPAVCRLVRQAFGVHYLPTKTIVGRALYRHSIDSHQASILRGRWYTWECIEPGYLGQRRQLEFGSAKVRRGRSGAVAAKLEQMGLQLDDNQLDRLIDLVLATAARRGWASEVEVEHAIRKFATSEGVRSTLRAAPASRHHAL